MKRHLPLLCIILFACAASFGPVVFRNWVLQHDIDGGGHTISNAVFEGDGSGLTGVGGGDMVWTNDTYTTHTIGVTNIVGIGTVGDLQYQLKVLAQPALWAGSLAVGPDRDDSSLNLYWSGINYGGIGNGGHGAGETVGLMGAIDQAKTNSLNYAVIGFTDAVASGQTNVSVAGTADKSLTVAVGGYFEIGDGYATPSNPIFETAVLLLDTRTNAVPLITARTNNATTVFSVAASGLTTSAAGYKKGAFTGITTTNTFYSVASDLLSTVTNVVVVQGGIITGWTVTP